MRRFIRAAAPNFGYGLTVLATLFLGNIGLHPGDAGRTRNRLPAATSGR